MCDGGSGSPPWAWCTQFLQPGEALLLYGVIGFALIPFYRRQPRTILLWSLLFALLEVVVSSYLNILAMFLLGLWAGKIGLFAQVDRYLRPFGQMALTNYIGQTLIILAIVHGFGLLGKLSAVETTLICFGLYLLQMPFSAFWLRRFRMGPWSGSGVGGPMLSGHGLGSQGHNRRG